MIAYNSGYCLENASKSRQMKLSQTISTHSHNSCSSLDGPLAISLKFEALEPRLDQTPSKLTFASQALIMQFQGLPLDGSYPTLGQFKE